jgi:hypothetical protein
MKISRRIIVTVLALIAVTARADIVTESFPFVGAGAIPDGALTGVSKSETVSSSILVLTEVEVDLTLSGEFNGDLYAYLAYGSDLAILLNRPGVTAVNPVGYADDGFNVTFKDDLLSGNDIHLYQPVQTPAPGNPLTGTWQPDARNVSPLTVDDADSRDAFLDGFNGQNPNGDWTLFVADSSAGGLHSVDAWTLRLTGDNIPEPANLLLLGLICLFATRHKWRATPIYSLRETTTKDNML